MSRKYNVIISKKAKKAISDRAQYIALQSGSLIIAERYADAVLDFCESLSIFPGRGENRDNLMPNLRITHYKKTTIIPYKIHEKTRTVRVLDVIHASQDFEKVLNKSG